MQMASIPASRLSMPNPLATEAWSLAGYSLNRTLECTSLGCLVIILWDILQCLPDEIALLRRRFTSVQLVYLGARLGPLFFMISQVLFIFKERRNCQSWTYVIATACLITHVSSGYLFLLRVKAVYSDWIWHQRTFTLIWVIHAAAAFFDYNGYEAFHIGPTLRCTVIPKQPFLGIMLISQALYEIIICSAITYKLCRRAAGQDQRPLRFWWSILRGGSSIDRLRARLLQDSQAYFMIAITLKLAQIIIYFADDATIMAPTPILNVAVTGILSSKIYRNFKLGKDGLFGARQSTIINSQNSSYRRHVFRAALGKQPSTSDYTTPILSHSYPPASSWSTSAETRKDAEL